MGEIVHASMEEHKKKGDVVGTIIMAPRAGHGKPRGCPAPALPDLPLRCLPARAHPDDALRGALLERHERHCCERVPGLARRRLLPGAVVGHGDGLRVPALVYPAPLYGRPAELLVRQHWTLRCERWLRLRYYRTGLWMVCL